MLTTNQVTNLHAAANALCNAQNQFTTLELKNELRKKYPNEIWNQMDVSLEMINLEQQGHFTYTDNGNFRTYYANPSLQGTQTASTTSVQTKTNKLIQRAMQTQTPMQTSSTPSIKRIGRTKALEIIENTNGKFFSVRFIKQNGDERLMACQYVKGTKRSPLGYVLLKDIKAGKSKSVNLQTLSEVKTNNTIYKVK